MIHVRVAIFICYSRHITSRADRPKENKRVAVPEKRSLGYFCSVHPRAEELEARVYRAASILLIVQDTRD